VAMQQRAAALGLTSAVLFTGPVPHAEIPRFIAAADMAIAPVPRMAQESWLSPMKVFEYMATGLAIVATEGGQTATVLEHERNALLVPAGEPEPLAAACARLLEDARLRERLGTRAREDALERHSWDAHI
jgi:glycosyltransferase involved in cell wall biosynthesis